LARRIVPLPSCETPSTQPLVALETFISTRYWG
jgi:hypothetical protein